MLVSGVLEDCKVENHSNYKCWDALYKWQLFQWKCLILPLQIVGARDKERGEVATS